MTVANGELSTNPPMLRVWLTGKGDYLPSLMANMLGTKNGVSP